ncbi:MAG: hypothetical protein SF123_23960 [Chloroflexota bacterium]|nr:hypothetical protein [Chloroflexota bacterium]
MADRNFVETVNAAIDRLNAGMSMEDCLRDFPDDASQLRPLLESGLLVRRILPSETELAAARSRSAERLEQALAQTPRRTQPVVRPFIWRMAQVAALFLLLFGVTGLTAESSLPGDTLYPLKRLTEGARMLLTGASFDERRISEIQTLLAQGRTETVQFSGVVEATGERWQVEGIPIMPPASVSDDIQVGDRVQVAGETTLEQVVRATSIVLLDDNTLPLTPSATPTVTVSATQMPTATVTATATASPTITPLASATRTPSSSPTITPLPSATASATTVPTLVFTPTPRPVIPVLPTVTDDDDDDDGDDNDSDNSGRGSGSSGRGGGSDDDGGDDGGSGDSGSSGGDDNDDDGD